MILQIVSGGQTGADQGGLEAAIALGIPVGGWAPKGWLTENGPDPTLEWKYGMKEHAKPGYPARTLANVQESDCTIIFGNLRSAGSMLTRELCVENKKPYSHIPGLYILLQEFRAHMQGKVEEAKLVDQFNHLRTTQMGFFRGFIKGRFTVLNIAGNRESVQPGIQQAVKSFLIEAIPLANK